MSLLKYENVALQARVEEQSVHTEQLEYELTKVKKKHNQDNNFADQREAQDTKQIADLKSMYLQITCPLLPMNHYYHLYLASTLLYQSIMCMVSRTNVISLPTFYLVLIRSR